MIKEDITDLHFIQIKHVLQLILRQDHQFFFSYMIGYYILGIHEIFFNNYPSIEKST